MSEATQPSVVDQLHTLALTEQQRQFLLDRGCSVEESRLTARVYCPPGTLKTYQNVEGIATSQGKGRLFLVAFPDRVTCQEWYFPTGESHLILPSETSDALLLTQRQIDALKLVLHRFITVSDSPFEEYLLLCYHSLLSQFEQIQTPQDILSLPIQESEFMVLYVALATMMIPLLVGLPGEEPLQAALKELLPVYQRIKSVADLLQAFSFERFNEKKTAQ